MNINRCTFLVVLAMFIFSYGTSRSVAQKSGYHIVKKFTLGGEGGWDYLNCDSSARRIYISRSTHVMVVDADTGAVVGDIPNTNGVHGIVFARELNRGFTSNGRDGTVTIFDLKTLQNIRTVKVGQNPDAILYDQFTKRVFTFNGGSRDASAIDAKTGELVGTVALGGRPESGVSDEKGKIFVNLEDKGQVVEFDGRTLTINATWSLTPGEEPTGIAIDRKQRRLFVGCANRLMAIMNADTGKVIATLPIGQGVDAVSFDPDTQLAFSSNGEGTITIIHEDAPDNFHVVETVPTQRGARTMTLDQKTHRLFTITAEFGPPPAPTAERPRPRAPMLPGTFTLLMLDR
jgi:YVTN family beta-propeller protein